MWCLLAQEQSEYPLMWLLVALLILLGILCVALPRSRRKDLLTDEEKKRMRPR